MKRVIWLMFMVLVGSVGLWGQIQSPWSNLNDKQYAEIIDKYLSQGFDKDEAALLADTSFIHFCCLYFREVGLKDVSIIIANKLAQIYVNQYNDAVKKYNSIKKKLPLEERYFREKRYYMYDKLYKRIFNTIGQMIDYKSDEETVAYYDLAKNRGYIGNELQCSIAFNLAEHYIANKKYISAINALFQETHGFIGSINLHKKRGSRCAYIKYSLPKGAVLELTPRDIANDMKKELIIGRCNILMQQTDYAEKLLLPLQAKILNNEYAVNLYGGLLNQLANLYIQKSEFATASMYLDAALAEYNDSIPKFDDLIRTEKLPYQLIYLSETIELYNQKNKSKEILRICNEAVNYIKKIVGDNWQTIFVEDGHLSLLFRPYFNNIVQFILQNHQEEGATGLLYDILQIDKSLFLLNPKQRQIKKHLYQDDTLSTFYQEMFKANVNAERFNEKRNDDLNLLIKTTLNMYLNTDQFRAYKHKKQLLGNLVWPESYQQTIQSLSENEALINYLVADTPDKTDRIYYALVLTKESEQPQLVTLCYEKELRQLINTPHNNKELYQLIWQPISYLLSGKKDLYIALDGLLHTVSYSSLHDGNNYLLDTYNLINILSPGELTQLKTRDSSFEKIKEIHLFGGVNFRALSETSKLDRAQGFLYLEESKNEILSIHELLKEKWKVHLYEGKDASEDNLRALSYQQAQPNVLHISTHGFNYPFTPPNNKNPNNKIKNAEADNNIFKRFSDPMFRTGIALSGANWAIKKPQLTADLLDGVVTAFEVEYLELGNTELVVLSACGTGLGQIKDGEGVFGLQRAFRNAGVRSMIVSLWDVPDKETSTLMQEFYAQWLSGKSKRQAFIDAQRKLRSNKRYSDNPKVWAGFVLIE